MVYHIRMAHGGANAQAVRIGIRQLRELGNALDVDDHTWGRGAVPHAQKEICAPSQNLRLTPMLLK